ncbi:hypothetical protein [Pelosinus sp. UFO1]|uniref:hypothetical protein n=1 Tax=Pelosinus sp. UFO1 TaxID=484770 RepID=UPI00056E624A|nr:hypothetical protein [Pelosinus sp. UFO1]
MDDFLFRYIQNINADRVDLVLVVVVVVILVVVAEVVAGAVAEVDTAAVGHVNLEPGDHSLQRFDDWNLTNYLDCHEHLLPRR